MAWIEVVQTLELAAIIGTERYVAYRAAFTREFQQKLKPYPCPLAP